MTEASDTAAKKAMTERSKRSGEYGMGSTKEVP